MFVRVMDEQDIETVMKTYDESTVFVQGPGRENMTRLDNIRRVLAEFLALRPLRGLIHRGLSAGRRRP